MASIEGLRMRYIPRLSPIIFLSLVIVAVDAMAGFVTFESGQVRPLAMSPDGTRLYAVNTPDNQLEIFNVVFLIGVNKYQIIMS